MTDLADALAQARARVEAAARAGSGPSEALDRAGQAVAAALAELRRVDPQRALVEAEATLERIAELARADGPRALPILVATTEQFARCCQRCRQFERGAAAFARASEGAELLVAAGALPTLALAELLSAQALCQAQAGALAQAHASAGRSVELARAQLWAGLPLAVGALSLQADLAADLGQPERARAHLELGLGLLADAAAAGQGGVAEAAARLRAELEHLTVPTPDAT